ncbi:MAG: hypothetical protein ACWGQW_08375, partial [bacterium]
DILEELLLFLAEAAGHRVEGTQSELDVGGIKGHRDAVIDGMLVDVKSASTYSFNKFRQGLTPDADAFGYLDQLQSYLYASQDDDVVTVKDRAAFLVVDKTLGHICLDVHEINNKDYSAVVAEKISVVESPEVPPRAFEDEKDGASGNRKLGLQCSYCDAKHLCWPGLRVFGYSNGPRFLTTVKKRPQPHIPELT